MKQKIKNQKSKIKNNIGFTLIEILVVISIIGILAAFLTTSYNLAQRQTRDAKRRGDMKSAQNAFEQYRVVNGRYPINSSEVQTYFQGNTVPSDPLNRNLYIYAYSFDPPETSYCVCAVLENRGKGNSISAGCVYQPGDYVCVGNLQ